MGCVKGRDNRDSILDELFPICCGKYRGSSALSVRQTRDNRKQAQKVIQVPRGQLTKINGFKISNFEITELFHNKTGQELHTLIKYKFE